MFDLELISESALQKEKGKMGFRDVCHLLRIVLWREFSHDNLLLSIIQINNNVRIVLVFTLFWDAFGLRALHRLVLRATIVCRINGETAASVASQLHHFSFASNDTFKFGCHKKSEKVVNLVHLSPARILLSHINISFQVQPAPPPTSLL